MPSELTATAFSGARALNASVLTAERQITEIKENQKKAFVHSLFFKIITFGIGIGISKSYKKEDERQINELKAGVKELYRRLDDAVRQRNQAETGAFTDKTFDVHMADEAVHFHIDVTGRLFARMADNPNEEEYALAASVEELRIKLAEDIFSHPDLFGRDDLLDLLPDPNENERNRQRVSIEETYERHVFLQVIENRSKIRGDQLENVTTANLRQLALAALGCDGDADAVTESISCIVDVVNTMVSADRLTSVEAEALVRAFEEQPKEVQETIEIAPTMKKAPSAPPEGTVEIPQRYRDLLADVLSAEFAVPADKSDEKGFFNIFSNRTDDETSVRNETAMLNVLVKHSDVLAEMISTPEDFKALRTALVGGDANQKGNSKLVTAFTALSVLVNSISRTFFSDLSEEAKKNVTGTDVKAKLGNSFGYLGKSTFPKEKKRELDDLRALNEKGELSDGEKKKRLEELASEKQQYEKIAGLLSAINTFAEQAARMPDEIMNSVTDMMKNEMGKIFKSNSGAPSWQNATTIDAMLRSAKDSAKESGYLKFVQTVLQNYFKDAAPQDKRSMVAAAFRYGRDGDGKLGMFGAMLKGAGPLLQKMLQGLDDSYFTPEFRRIFDDMKKNLAPIDDKQIQAYLLDIKNRSGGKITSIRANESLGAASVGVVLDCTVQGRDKDDHRDLAVKMLRPDALVRIGREKGWMLKYAKECQMEKTYEEHLKTVMREFDFTEEAENIKRGEIYNKGSKRVQSVKMDSVVAATPSTLVMEKAPGRTVADVIADTQRRIAELKAQAATNPQKAREDLKALYKELMTMHKDLCSFAKQWLTEGIFGSGFFHGDLHSANLTIDLKKGVRVLDFGNAKQLTKDEQENITRVMAAASIGSKAVDFFITGFRDLLKDEGRRFFSENETEIRELVNKVLSAGDRKDAGSRIFIILSKLQQMGVEIPGPVFAFSQSENRLEATIDGMTKVMDEIREAIFTLPSAQMKGTVDYDALLYNSVARQFAIEVENKWKTTEQARLGNPTKSAFDKTLDEKFDTLSQSCAGRFEGAHRTGILKHLENSEQKDDQQIGNTIARFMRMNVPGSEKLKADYDAYFRAQNLKEPVEPTGLPDEPIGNSLRTLLGGKNLRSAMKAKFDYDKLESRHQDNFSDAHRAVIEDVIRHLKTADGEAAAKGFLDFLKAKRLEASEAQEAKTEGSLAYYKEKIYAYLLNEEEGKSVVGSVVEEVKSEWAKVKSEWKEAVALKDKLPSLKNAVVDGFIQADLACLRMMHDSSRGLEKHLPKNRPDRFVDCVADVLTQNAVSAFKRLSSDLVNLGRMA